MIYRVKKYLGFILTFILICGVIYTDTISTKKKNQNRTNLNSRIMEVTVFPDRALVIRTGTKFLSRGEHILYFDKLPELIDENSVQVKGKGAAVLREVSVKKIRFKKIPIKKIKELFEKKQNLEEQLQVLEHKEDQVEKEKEFLEKITRKLTGVTEKSQPTELNPDKWIKMVAFYRSKLEALDKEIFETEKLKKKLNKEQKQIEWKIEDMEELKEQLKYKVIVKVFMKKEGELKLNLSYFVSGPKWVPVFDIHVNSEEKLMKLKYQAFIKQNTGEDWTNVKLKLSTAKPALGAKHPALSLWYIGYQSPKKTYRKVKNKIDTRFSSAENVFSVDGVNATNLRNEKNESMDIEEEFAAVEAGSTVVAFVISGKNTIRSNKSKHKLTIMTKKLPIQFRYSTIPKLKKYAYLKAQIINNTNYPLLPGKSSVFLNNNFISNSELSFAAVNQKFWTFLGVDEGIRIKYNITKPFNENKGLFKKKNKLTYKRSIIIEYNKNKQEELLVRDQIPISNDESIKINLIEPKIDSTNPFIKFNKRNRNNIEWLLKPKPGEKIKINLKFSIEYPRDKKLKGHMIR